MRTFGYFNRNFQPKWVLSRLKNPKKLNYFVGNAGDCMIVNTQECIHAASIPKANSYRDMLQFIINPAKGKLKSKKDIFNNINSDNEKEKSFITGLK